MRSRQTIWGLLAGVLLGGCGAASGQVRYTGSDLIETHVAMVTHAEGATVQVGDRCTVSVERPRWIGYNCRVELRCGDEVLYGLPGSGYNQCRENLTGVTSASDERPTRLDGDPMMELNVVQGMLTLQDSDPYLRLTVALQRN